MNNSPSLARRILVGIILLGSACAPSPELPATPVPTARPSATPTATPTSQIVEVRIKNISFQPTDVTMGVGTTIHWIHEDGVPHTTTSNTRIWQSGTMVEGDSFQFKFAEPGVYNYFCEFHAGMEGTITVVATSREDYYQDY